MPKSINLEALNGITKSVKVCKMMFFTVVNKIIIDSIEEQLDYKIEIINDK